MTKVINIFKDPVPEENYVYIGRPSFYGNPYEIGKHGNREQVLEKYRNYLKSHPDIVGRAKRELKGKTLGCFCKPYACHGDILKEYINE